LDWVQALRENLMSSVFGDLQIILTDRIYFYLDAEVETEKPLPQQPAIFPSGNHTMKITGAGFLLDGNPTSLSNELSWVVMRAEMRNEVKVTGEKTVRVGYSPEPETMLSLTDLALMFLLWNEKEGDPDWDRVVREPIPILAANVRTELRNGLNSGVIRYVLEQRPITIPDFLPK
jgi:hypothetical protein